MVQLYICIPIILILVVFILYLNKKIKNITKVLHDEIINVIDKLRKLTYGNLTASFDSMDIKQNKGKLGYLYNDIYAVKEQFNEITSEPINRICYIGANSYHEGRNCGYLFGERCPSNSKIIIIVTTTLDGINNLLKVRGFTSVLNEQFPSLNILEIFEAHASEEKTYEFIKNSLSKNNNIKGIYITGSIMGPIAAKCLVDHNKAEQIFLLCHDINKEIANCLRQKSLSAVLFQDTYVQGYNAILYLYNHTVAKWRPIQPRIMTKMQIINSDNVDLFWDSKNDELIKSEALIAKLVTPLKHSDKKMKIMVLGEDWSSTLLQINKGIIEASQLLKNYNADVQLIIINQLKRSKDEVIKEIDMLMKRAIDEKYDGIATYAGIKEIVPYLNKVATSGIPIVTYNCEPNNLRNMIKWLNDSSNEMRKFSDVYQLRHHEINSSMGEILKEVHNIVERIIQQTESAREGALSTEKILALLENSVTGEERQLETVLILSDISGNMSKMTKSLDDQIDELKEVQLNVNSSAKKISVMSEYSKQIKHFLEIIEDISNKTKLLALNSSIEAARSGIHGKGFEVISSEIRKLSERSNKSTKDVTDIIQNIQKIIDDNLGVMNQSKQKINSQVNVFVRLIEQIEKLVQTLLETMSSIKETADRNRKDIFEIQNNSQLMATMINESATKSQDNSVAMEEIKTTIGQISKQLNDMNVQTNIISDIVNVLQGYIGQFSIEQVTNLDGKVKLRNKVGK